MTSQPLATHDTVELAILERSGMIESRHLGAAIVLSPDGEELRMLGNADALVYPRSSLKPVQAVAVLRSGVQLDGEQLALATASHAGTAEHQRVALEILTRAGLTEDDLDCPADWPSDPAAEASARVAGGPRRLAMNCSGKHAAFLLACVHNGWSFDDYLDPLHPLQRLIMAVVEEFTGTPIGHFGTDGCGAPLFGISLRSLARATSRVARGEEESTARLVAAILQHPWAMDGPGRANTVVVEELGLIAKLGAEGVNVMAARDGTTVAVKMLDGNGRATTLVALELLASVGAVDPSHARQVSERTAERVLGGGEPVGELRAAF
ncbi:MAG TPA: asparaginase [Homoserinimonas sp.]|nr:asparaginase [Homoserinimonas sp.]